MTDHLTDRLLLRFVDGELPGSARRAAARHLSSCWSCRAELDRLTHDIGVIVEAQTRFVLPAAPPPPKRWSSLDRRLVEAGMSTRTPRLGMRLPLSRLVRAGGFVAASAIVSWALLWIFPARVTAEQVLRRISAADTKRMQVTPRSLVLQRVRVTRTERVSSRQTVGSVDCWLLSGKVYWRAAAADTAVVSLKGHAANASVDGQLPLSPASYKAWFDRAGGFVRTQQTLGPSQIALVATNRKPSEELREVRLIVETRKWRVASLSLAFPNEQLEIAEEQLAIVPRDRAPQDVLASLDSSTGNISSRRDDMSNAKPPALLRPDAPKLGQITDLDDVELDVRMQLHRMNADLGEPIEIERTASQVTIKAWNAAPERQAELERTFRNRRDVLLQTFPSRLSSRGDPETGLAVAPEHPAPDRASRTEDPRLMEFFGGFRQQENFIGSVLDADDILESHLYALHNLAKRFDTRGEARLSPLARQNLRLLVNDHSRAALEQLTSLHATLDPLFRHFLNDAESPAPPSLKCRWQDCAASALTATKEAGRALRSLLTTSASPIAVEDALPLVRNELLKTAAVLESRASIP